MKLACLSLILMTVGLARAAAADLCAPLENLRKRDLAEGAGLYRACRDGNELYDRANADLGIRASFNPAEMESYIGRGADPALEKKAFSWNRSVSESVRLNAAAKEVLLKAVRAAQNPGDPDLKDPRRQARLEAAAQALAKVALKGENLKRFLIIQTGKIRSAHQLEKAVRDFYDEEPLVFRAPATIE